MQFSTLSDKDIEKIKERIEQQKNSTNSDNISKPAKDISASQTDPKEPNVDDPD
jgi:hypothetical protein